MNHDIGVRRKILHIIHGFSPGGVETWLLATVKYLHQHPELNLKFDFLLTGGVPGIFDEEIKMHGSKIFYFRYSNSSLRSFRNAFRQVLKNNDYIAVHDHQDFISGWHFLLGGSYLPAVRIAHLHNPYNFVHNYVVNPIRWISFNAGRKLMAHYATKITGTSDAVMDEYGYDKGVFNRKRTSPAYCGFDTKKFNFNSRSKQELCNQLNWDVSANIALFVGRIGLQPYDTAANQKNPEFAFEVAKQLIASHQQWNFLFVGYKGETGARMEAEMIREKLDSRIKFLDIRHDIPDIMSAADVLIFPSLWEGLGMVAVEAQCSGLNVVMTNTVPQEAIVCSDLVTIKTVDEGPGAWVNTITTLSLNGNRDKYADKLRQSPFSIENSVDRMIALYES